MIAASSQCNIVSRPAAPADRINRVKDMAFWSNAGRTMKIFKDMPRSYSIATSAGASWSGSLAVKCRITSATACLRDQRRRFVEGGSQIGVRPLIDEVADGRLAAGKRGPRRRGVVVRALGGGRRSDRRHMHVRIHAARQHQHPLRLDDPASGSSRQVPPNLGDGAVANSQISGHAASRGDDDSIADDELRRCLGRETGRRRDRQGKNDPPCASRRRGSLHVSSSRG